MTKISLDLPDLFGQFSPFVRAPFGIRCTANSPLTKIGQRMTPLYKLPLAGN
ncbi:hypothetical protein ACFQAT_01840 [Undibacterium arcticum]|uniref:Uncharacterized protein n=1 Tax=Undibacterium arcticum TaxID=1762892 RepID=A0ABV7F4N3_9BURK